MIASGNSVVRCRVATGGLTRGSEFLGAPNSGAGFYIRLGPPFGSTSFRIGHKCNSPATRTTTLGGDVLRRSKLLIMNEIIAGIMTGPEAVSGVRSYPIR